MQVQHASDPLNVVYFNVCVYCVGVFQWDYVWWDTQAFVRKNDALSNVHSGN
jgi:hypothetical protein